MNQIYFLLRCISKLKIFTPHILVQNCYYQVEFSPECLSDLGAGLCHWCSGHLSFSGFLPLIPKHKHILLFI